MHLVVLAIPKHDYFIKRAGTLADVEQLVVSGTDFIDESILLTSETGLKVHLRVRRPVQNGEVLPLVVLLGGQRTGKDAVELIGIPDEMAFVAIDYPYDGRRRIEGVLQTLAAVDDVQQAFLDTPPSLSLALSWALRQPWVDPRRIELVGVSLGVPFAAVAGATDPRFTRVWLLHGGVDNVSWLDHASKRRIEQDWLRSIVVRGILFITYGNSFDTLRRIEDTAPRPVVFVAACGDDFVPRESIEPLLGKSFPNVEVVFTDGLHINPARPRELRQLLELVTGRIAGKARAETIRC